MTQTISIRLLSGEQTEERPMRTSKEIIIIFLNLRVCFCWFYLFEGGGSFFFSHLITSVFPLERAADGFKLPHKLFQPPFFFSLPLLLFILFDSKCLAEFFSSRHTLFFLKKICCFFHSSIFFQNCLVQEKETFARDDVNEVAYDGKLHGYSGAIKRKRKMLIQISIIDLVSLNISIVLHQHLYVDVMLYENGRTNGEPSHREKHHDFSKRVKQKREINLDAKTQLLCKLYRNAVVVI